MYMNERWAAMFCTVPEAYDTFLYSGKAPFALFAG
jgi:hypothetical protein